ncbi:MAG TPA: hypothetical protein VH853_05235 [Polyangia bacterium]|nr:hypothetical protein [Polyangia bacterium]
MAAERRFFVRPSAEASRVALSPMVNPSQHTWLSTKVIPDLVLKTIQPKQLGQSLRRSFVFCDMDP